MDGRSMTEVTKRPKGFAPKINEDTAYQMLMSGKTAMELKKEYPDLNVSTIRRVLSGESWKNAYRRYSREKHGAVA